MENIAYVIFCADIARLLQYFNNISDRFRSILVIIQYFQGIFLQYCLNISVLCEYYICTRPSGQNYYIKYHIFNVLYSFWMIFSRKQKYKNINTRRKFLREILYKNIAIIAIQHSKIYFVDTLGDFSHTVEWNSLKSVWQISLYI